MDGTNKVVTPIYMPSKRGEFPEGKIVLTPKLGESLSNSQQKYQRIDGHKQGQEEENGEVSTKGQNFDGLQEAVSNIKERAVQVRELQRKKPNVQIPMEEAPEDQKG